MLTYLKIKAWVMGKLFRLGLVRRAKAFKAEVDIAVYPEKPNCRCAVVPRD